MNLITLTITAVAALFTPAETENETINIHNVIVNDINNNEWIKKPL